MSLTKILVGDDQMGGRVGHLFQMSFEDTYREQLKDCEIKYIANPEAFVQEARNGYDILLIDLNWTDEDFGKCWRDRTGFQVLNAVRDYAPRRVLWTSDAEKAREEALKYGATSCISKKASLEDFAKAIGLKD